MNILIVEDHAATVTFMKLAFATAGHTVSTASNVDEALHCAAEAAIDVVLTDLTFGDAGVVGDGLQLARSLRAAPSTSSVGLLAVSGDDSPAVLRATVESGFDGFVSKPVDLASLSDRVERLAEVVSVRRASQHQIDRS